MNFEQKKKNPKKKIRKFFFAFFFGQNPEKEGKSQIYAKNRITKWRGSRILKSRNAGIPCTQLGVPTSGNQSSCTIKVCPPLEIHKVIVQRWGVPTSGNLSSYSTKIGGAHLWKSIKLHYKRVPTSGNPSSYTIKGCSLLKIHQVIVHIQIA